MKHYHLSHQQLAAATIALLAVGLGIVYFLNSHYFQGDRVNAAGIRTQALTTMLARGDKLLGSTDQLMAAVKSSPLELAPAPQKTPSSSDRPLWQTANRNAPTPSIPLSDRILAYESIQLDQHPASMPVAGQEVSLPLLKGELVRAQVESGTLHENGDYSWRGHLKGHGSDYPVVMTYGESGIYATITTPEGSYSLESINGLGWLYKNPAEPDLSAAGAVDHLEPPQ